MSRETTESVRIDRELLEKIKFISRTKGQTISGYINNNLSKTVNKQWLKISNQNVKGTESNL